MKNLSIKIDDELHSQLIEKASESNKSLADFVRTVLRGDHVDDTRTFHSDVSEIIQEFRMHVKNSINFKVIFVVFKFLHNFWKFNMVI